VEMNQETGKTQHHIRVCQGINCRRNGSPELMEQLQQLLSQDETFQIKPYLCFGACDMAPNIVVVPDRLWYSFVAPEYMEDIAAAIRKGKDVSGLANHVRPVVRGLFFLCWKPNGISCRASPRKRPQPGRSPARMSVGEDPRPHFKGGYHQAVIFQRLD
jgi:(2Fe-2S) ferredoxin